MRVLHMCPKRNEMVEMLHIGGVRYVCHLCGMVVEIYNDYKPDKVPLITYGGPPDSATLKRPLRPELVRRRLAEVPATL